MVLHAYWYWLRSVEPEIRLLNQLSTADTIAIDVGAHYGIYTYFLLRHSQRVVAFEPNPFLANRLSQIFRSRVQVNLSALSDVPGKTKLVIPLSGTDQLSALASIEPGVAAGSTSTLVLDVPVSTLDTVDFGGGKVGFIKVDVEGHELKFLQGAAQILARDKPNLLIEAEERHRHDAVGSIERFLCGFGYKGYFLLDGALHPIGDFSVAVHQRISRPIPGSKADKVPYVNNFIFLANEASLYRLKRPRDDQ